MSTFTHTDSDGDRVTIRPFHSTRGCLFLTAFDNDDTSGGASVYLTTDAIDRLRSFLSDYGSTPDLARPSECTFANWVSLKKENESLTEKVHRLEDDAQWSAHGHEKKNREITNLEHAINSLKIALANTKAKLRHLERAQNEPELSQENARLRTALAALVGEEH